MRRWGAVGLVLVLVAGCSRGTERKEPGLTEAWRQAGVTPIGQPVAAGDTVVVYGTVDKNLYLYGIAVADGTIRWRQAATPSLVVNGIPFTPDVIDGRPVYFRPDPLGNLAARLVVAAPDTGADVLVSDPVWFRSDASHCTDGKDICVKVEDQRGQTSWRFSVDRRALVADPVAVPAGARFLGDGLLDLGQRRPEVLAGLKDGVVAWTTPLTRLLPAGFSSDVGWHFERYRSAGLHVGSLGRAADRDDSAFTVTDLAKSQTIAVNADTGAPAWHAEGTRFVCNSKIVVRRKVAEDRTEPWPVRCRYRGTMRYDKAAQVVRYEGLDVTVEGFDVASGTTTWSVPLGAAEAFMTDEARATPVDDTEVLVPGAAGPVIIDVSDGSTRPPAPAEVFWCAENVGFQYREPAYLPSGAAVYDWRGGHLLRRCGADGSPSTAPPRHLARSLGASVGERTVIAEAGGLVAFDRAGRG